MPVLRDPLIKRSLTKKGIDLDRAKYYESKLDHLKTFLDGIAANTTYDIQHAPRPAPFVDLRNPYGFAATHNVMAKAVTGEPGASLVARLAALIDGGDKSVVSPYANAMSVAHSGPDYANPAPAEVTTFNNTNTLARHAVDMIASNFENRLQDFFNRLRDDWEDIGKLFFPQNVLVQLSRITITDSDSHKKGSHVFILNFDVAPVPRIGPPPPPRTGFLALFSRGPQWNHLDLAKLEVACLVYKPGDLELDYRLLADTQTVHNRLPAPLSPLPVTPHGSLLEVVQPVPPLLPTYLILPRKPGSLAVQRLDHSWPIDESYGYIQFLRHEPKRHDGDGEPLKEDFFGRKLDWSTCPADKLDWITLNLADIDTFCQIYGWYMAIGMTFSFNDSHPENVMVYQRKPCLIDVEISFKSQTDNISATMLDKAVVAPVNHLSGQAFYNQLYYLSGRRANPVSALRLNHLGQIQEIGYDPFYFQQIRTGFYNAWAHLQHIMVQLNAWLADPGLQNTFCRYTSESTGTYWNLYRELYGSGHCLNLGPAANTFGEQLADAWYRQAPFQQFLKSRLSDWDGASRPNWATMTPQHGLADLVNCDVPMFYHRINSNDIINARGFVVNCAPLAGADIPPDTWDAATFAAKVLTFTGRAHHFGVHYFQPAAVAATFVPTQIARLATPAGDTLRDQQADWIRDFLRTMG